MRLVHYVKKVLEDSNAESQAITFRHQHVVCEDMAMLAIPAWKQPVQEKLTQNAIDYLKVMNSCHLLPLTSIKCKEFGLVLLASKPGKIHDCAQEVLDQLDYPKHTRERLGRLLQNQLR